MIIVKLSRLFICGLLSTVLGTMCLSTPSLAQQNQLMLNSFKDSEFAYPGIISASQDDSFIEVDYNEMRDVNGRDEVPVKKALDERVQLLEGHHEANIRVGGRPNIDTFQAGRAEGAEFAVIFVHGGGGDKYLGFKDWSFGGNFNRLKNLAVQNDGVYYSPTVNLDGRAGGSMIDALMTYIKIKSPNAKIVVACGSAGASVCWRLAKDEESVQKLDGLILLGGAAGSGSLHETPFFAKAVPLIIAHGSRDGVKSWKSFKKDFDRIKEKDPNYPVKFLLFNEGIHGTPIRMIDWRTELNWIFQI